MRRLCRVWRARQRSTREIELEEQVSFEAFRDLIRLKCLGLSGEQEQRDGRAPSHHASSSTWLLAHSSSWRS